MFIKRLFLACMLLGTFNQVIFPSTDRHAKWIEHTENEMVKNLPAQSEKEKAVVVQDDDNSSTAGIVAVGCVSVLGIIYYSLVKK